MSTRMSVTEMRARHELLNQRRTELTKAINDLWPLVDPPRRPRNPEIASQAKAARDDAIAMKSWCDREMGLTLQMIEDALTLQRLEPVVERLDDIADEIGYRPRHTPF